MKGTYKSLRCISKMADKSQEEMIEDYQEGKHRSEIVAYIYCENLGYLIDRANKYQSIEEQDKASYALQSIHRALENYRETNAKLISLIGLYFEQELKDEIKYQQYQKRKGYIDSIDRIRELVESSDITDFKFTKLVTKDNGMKNFNYSKIKSNLKKTDKLTDKQKKIIKHLLDSNGGGIENISSDLNMTDDEIEEEMKKIKKKNIYDIIS